MFGKSKPIEIKSVDELALMRQAGLVVAKTLEKMRSEIAVGMTTADLDALARESIAAAPISWKDNILNSSPKPGMAFVIRELTTSKVPSRFEIPVPPDSTTTSTSPR